MPTGGWPAAAISTHPGWPSGWRAFGELAAREGKSAPSVSYQDGPATPECIEAGLEMGLERLIFRVPASDESAVAARLEELVDLVGPYRS